MEEIESALRNLYGTYQFRNRKESDSKMNFFTKLKWLGGMEAFLQVVGKLSSSIPHQYKIEHKKFFFIPFTVTESYEKYILRNCAEHINDREKAKFLKK